MIDAFTGRYRFLSNFYPVTVSLDGIFYPSVEHAYQAAKTTDPEERVRVRRARTPGLAKRRGQRVTLRAGWDEVKLGIMYDLVLQKFTRHAILARQLSSTGDQELVEGNYWGDTFWGQCPVGAGFNHLGKILMRVRGELGS